MEAIEKGDAIRMAAEKVSVPRSSLHDRVSGRVQHGKQPSKPPYLTLEEEESSKILDQVCKYWISSHKGPSFSSSSTNS